MERLIANMKGENYSPYLENYDGMMCLKFEICPSCGENKLCTFYHALNSDKKICICGYSFEYYDHKNDDTNDYDNDYDEDYDVPPGYMDDCPDNVDPDNWRERYTGG